MKASDPADVFQWTHLRLDELIGKSDRGDHIDDDVANRDDDPRDVGYPAPDVKNAGNCERQSNYLSKASGFFFFSVGSLTEEESILSYLPCYEKLKVAYEITHFSVCLCVCMCIPIY
jgi:hypothetical protein